MEEKNEFKDLADQIGEKYFMTHREISRKIGIDEVSFTRYYNGTRGATEELINNLKELNNNKDFTVVETKINIFKIKVDELINKYKVSKEDIINELKIDKEQFDSYYEGTVEAGTNVTKLHKYVKSLEDNIQRDNEFRKLVNQISDNYFMTHREIARRIGITEVAFVRYYDGSKQADEITMNNLKELSNNKEFDVLNKENKFKKMIDKIQITNPMMDFQLAGLIPISRGLFHDYYMGKQIADDELIGRLKKLFEELKNNKFKEYVEKIKTGFIVSDDVIANELGINKVSFDEYFSGLKIPTDDVIDNLKEMYAHLDSVRAKKLFDLENRILKKFNIERNDLYRKFERVNIINLFDRAIEDGSEDELMNMIEEKLKDNNTNEFKELVDKLFDEYKMIHREIATKLNITDVNFHLYYEGFKEASTELLKELNNLLKLKNNGDKPNMEEELNKSHYVNSKNQYEFTEIVHRLSKLSKEHKKEVYDLINSYSEEERIEKKLTPNNK